MRGQVPILPQSQKPMVSVPEQRVEVQQPCRSSSLSRTWRLSMQPVQLEEPLEELPEEQSLSW